MRGKSHSRKPLLRLAFSLCPGAVKALMKAKRMAKNIVYFDLETQKSAEEVGGWDKISRMGMSIGVTFGAARGDYRIYAERHINDLLADLQRADLIVGFNNPALRLRSAARLHDIRPAPAPDAGYDGGIAEHNSSTGSRSIPCHGDFGVEKTAEGMQAIRWFKDGKLLEIAEYCCYDVKLTKLVHEYGQRHKQLHYHNRFGKKQTVPVSW